MLLCDARKPTGTVAGSTCTTCAAPTTPAPAPRAMRTPPKTRFARISTALHMPGERFSSAAQLRIPRYDYGTSASGDPPLPVAPRPGLEPASRGDEYNPSD